MKAKKLVVDFDYNFRILGLRSSVKEYKLAWSINRALHVNLEKNEEMKMQFKGQATGFVSLYAHETETSCITLVKNRVLETSDKKVRFLLPELNHLDYLIRIDGDTYPNTPEKIIQVLRDVDAVEYITTFNVNEIKSRENLLFY